MIRLRYNRIYLPRGDSGSIIIPTIGSPAEGDKAVFAIYNPRRRETILEKIVDASQDHLVVDFQFEDTKDIAPGKYQWDIKIYKNPIYEDGKMVGASEINSYYAAYQLPDFTISEVASNVSTP